MVMESPIQGSAWTKKTVTMVTTRGSHRSNTGVMMNDSFSKKKRLSTTLFFLNDRCCLSDIEFTSESFRATTGTMIIIYNSNNHMIILQYYYIYLFFFVVVVIKQYVFVKIVHSESVLLLLCDYL